MGHVFRLALLGRLGRRRVVFFVAKFNRPDLELLRAWLESGALRPVVERVYRFAELPEALRVMGEGHARAKLVVSLDAAAP
jgi:NADPH:quinone reductase-like Zn-dependent oxidoreductase